MADEEPDTVRELRRRYDAFAALPLPHPPLSDEELVAELRERAKAGPVRATGQPERADPADGADGAELAEQVEQVD